MGCCHGPCAAVLAKRARPASGSSVVPDRVECALSISVDRLTPLRRLFADGSICLVRTSWLGSSLVDRGAPLVPRQSLPSEALCEPAEAVRSVDEHVAAISHAWLGRDHPDPKGRRRQDVSLLLAVAHVSLVFWDFLSLHQRQRSPTQDSKFRAALASMHLVYGNQNWYVYRLTTLPSGMEDSFQYQGRGWCLFESTVASMGCRELRTLHRGSWITGCATPVPLSPERFWAVLQGLRFAREADRAMVADLYRQAHQAVAGSALLTPQAWGDAEALELLAALPVLRCLKVVHICNNLQGCTARVSAPIAAQLRAALEARGGRLWLLQGGSSRAALRAPMAARFRTAIESGAGGSY